MPAQCATTSHPSNARVSPSTSLMSTPVPLPRSTGLRVAALVRLQWPPLHPDLVAIPTVRPESTRDIAAVHRRSQADSPALQAVLDAVRAVAGGRAD